MSVAVWGVVTSFLSSSAKGKGFRLSPLCASHAVDVSSDTENDKEVEGILSKSQPSASGKRTADEDVEEESDTENEKRQETHASEPANVTSKLFVIFATIISTSCLLWISQ